MGLRIIVSAHAPVEITKPHVIRLGHAVLEAEVFVEFLNGKKGQIIQEKTAIMNLNIWTSIYFVMSARNERT